MGSFYVGGREAAVSGNPVRNAILRGEPPVPIDLNGTYQVEQLYAQYFIPARVMVTGRRRRGREPPLLSERCPFRDAIHLQAGPFCPLSA